MRERSGLRDRIHLHLGMKRNSKDDKTLANKIEKNNGGNF